MDETQILIDLKAGDKKAFNLLYDLLYEQVYVFTRQITKDEMEAEDIALHSLAKFWEKGAWHFETFLQVKTFIFRIARNDAYDFLKREGEQKNYRQNIAQVTMPFEESVAEPAERARYKVEMLQVLYYEIEKLPGLCRETFKLVFIQNMPWPVVAEKLNISPGTVHNHCDYAGQRLRQVFREKELTVLLLLIGLCPN